MTPRYHVITLGHTEGSPQAAFGGTGRQDGGAPSGAPAALETAFREAVGGRALREVFEGLDAAALVPEFTAPGSLPAGDRALYDRGLDLCRTVLGGGLPAAARPAVRGVTHALAKWFALVTHQAANPRAVATLLAVALIDAAADLPDGADRPHGAEVDGLPWREDPTPKRRAGGALA